MAINGKRRKFFVDKKIQGALLARATRYWFLCATVVGSLTLLGWMFISPGIVTLLELRAHLPSLLGALIIASASSLLILPLILYDLTKMTNRFAGPMLNLRNTMLRAAAGEDVKPIQLRDDDYGKPLADAFNQLLKRIESTRCDAKNESKNENTTPEYAIAAK